MTGYKKLLEENNLQQKDLLLELHAIDKKVDKALLSKIVNHIVLPTKKQLTKICEVLKCHVLDLYDANEIDLINISRNVPIKKKKNKLSAKYNLHVEIDRKLADKVLSQESLNKLGISKISDYIRDCINALVLKLDRIDAPNEKPASSKETD